MTYKSMIDEITGILPGSEFTDQLSILSIPGRVLDVMKITITHFTLFKDPFAGPATRTAQLHVWWHESLKSISPRNIGMEPTLQWLGRVCALFKPVFLADKQCLAKMTTVRSTLAHKAKQSIQSLYELNNKPETEVLRKVGCLLEKDRFTCPRVGRDACCP
jgi:hypothetical protein